MKMNWARYSGAMPIRQACAPTPFLFTDVRVADVALLRAIRRLPVGAGVIFRHYELVAPRRAALFDSVKRLARRRGLRLIVAGQGPRRFANMVGTHASAANAKGRRAPLTASAHTMDDLAKARRRGATAVFISPVFATNSHKGARPIGPMAYQRMARRAEALGLIPLPLGGMTVARARMLKARGFGAIDGLIRR
jgi:thiamine-phosphate pyrophosphorylase